MTEFTLLQGSLLALVGVIAGFVNVMAGGGSMLSVPVLLFMGLPGPVANGTARVAILAQNLSACVAFFRRGLQDFKLSLTLSACAVPGAIVGAMIGVQLDGVWFNRVLAIVMVAVMVVMQFSSAETTAEPDQPPSRRQLWWGHLLMLGVGFWGGFIQIGVGFIIMPVLHRVMGLNLVHTNMHKVVIIGIYTIAALLVFASQIGIHWLAGGVLALGSAVGGYLGAHFSVSRGEILIRTLLNLVLMVFVIKLLFFN